MVDFDKPAGDVPPAYGPPPAGYPPPGYPPRYPPVGYPGYGPPGPVPSTNIGWAIAAVLLFWPLAIPAFIFSSRVEPYWFQGDVAGAHKASHDARLYGMIGVIVGAVFFVIGVVGFIVFFVFLTHTIGDVNRFVPTPYPS